MSSTLLIQIGDKVRFIAATFIIQRRFLMVLRKEFDSGESCDSILLANVCILLVICINVGDDTLIISSLE